MTMHVIREHVLLFNHFLFISAPSWCTGFFYKGVCLQSILSSSSRDHVPASCNAYQPAVSWSQADFIAICTHFHGTYVGCGNIDTDRNGGRCYNYQAVIGYELNSNPDVWVNGHTFSWYPAAGAQDCQLLTNPPGSIVYACQAPGVGVSSGTLWSNNLRI